MLGSGEQVARLVHDRTRAQKLARHRLKRLPHEPGCHNVVRRDALGADIAEDMILSVGVMEVATDTAKSAERSAVRPSIFVPRRPRARMPAQADIGAQPRAPPRGVAASRVAWPLCPERGARGCRRPRLVGPAGGQRGAVVRGGPWQGPTGEVAQCRLTRPRLRFPQQSAAPHRPACPCSQVLGYLRRSRDGLALPPQARAASCRPTVASPQAVPPQAEVRLLSLGPRALGRAHCVAVVGAMRPLRPEDGSADAGQGECHGRRLGGSPVACGRSVVLRATAPAKISTRDRRLPWISTRTAATTPRTERWAGHAPHGGTDERAVRRCALLLARRGLSVVVVERCSVGSSLLSRGGRYCALWGGHLSFDAVHWRVVHESLGACVNSRFCLYYELYTVGVYVPREGRAAETGSNPGM